MNAVYSVRQLAEKLKGTLEGVYPFVWVKGEVSNLSRPASGHVYFALKEQDALLHCVWFRHQQRDQEHFDPLTGEVFEDGPRPSIAHTLENGQQLMCAGRISLYAPRGVCQLVVELAQLDGQGALAARFEMLKRKLADKGYFAMERKRALPFDPQRVALVTAATGAVIHDFCSLAAPRGSGAQMRLYPVLVQGDGAAPAISAALQAINADGWAQVIVLMRGGGSLEDLWAFNEEAVADAVYSSAIPVVAAIGHESDVSLADMTADVRAATPSHAAQLLWPERAELVQRVDTLESYLEGTMQTKLQRMEQAVARQQDALRWVSPHKILERVQERLLYRTERLYALGAACISSKKEQLLRITQQLQQGAEQYLERRTVAYTLLQTRLEVQSPLAPLARGYALVHDSQGRLLKSVCGVALHDALRLTLHDGTIDVVVRHSQKNSDE